METFTLDDVIAHVKKDARERAERDARNNLLNSTFHYIFEGKDVVLAPAYSLEDWEQYVKVQERFAVLSLFDRLVGRSWEKTLFPK